MKCDKCGAELLEDVLFCRECGSRVQIDERLVCDNCGAEMEKGAKFCAICGTPAKMQECENCGKIFSREFEVCPACGHIIPGAVTDNKVEEPAVTEKTAVAEEPAAEPVPVTDTDTAVSVNTAREISTDLDNPIGFMALDEFLVDEKVSTFKFTNSYLVYDMNGNIVGAVQQSGISGGAKAARILVGRSAKSLQSFTLNILDQNGTILGSVGRDGGAFTYPHVTDAEGNVIARLERGVLKDVNGQFICKFKIGLKSIPLADEQGNVIGTITRKWNGAGKMFFTTAEKYHMAINQKYTGTTRLCIAALMIGYDMISGDR